MTGTTHTHIHSVARYHIGLLGRNAHARTQADKLTNRLARAPRYGVFSFRSLATRWWWRLNIVVACLLGYFRRRSIANGNPVTAPCATELLTTTRSELSPITCPLTETSSAFTCTSNPREDYKPQVLSVLALAALESHAVFSSLFTVNILLSVSTEHSSGLKRDRKNDTARKHNLTYRRTSSQNDARTHQSGWKKARLMYKRREPSQSVGWCVGLVQSVRFLSVRRPLFLRHRQTTT